MSEIKIINNDCLIALKDYPDNHFDSVVSDPPYGISFMNKKWDYEIPSVELWKEVLRILKPGGHVLIACGTRTQHRMAVNIEDAGFEIRDVITWHYGSGFPKSHNIGIAMDKLQGNDREIIGKKSGTYADIKRDKETGQDSLHGGKAAIQRSRIQVIETKGSSEAEGWGTALKPATEFWTLARKPLSEKSVAENFLKHGTGGINIDGTRIELNGDYKCMANCRPSLTGLGDNYDPIMANKQDTKGRFPANVIFDEQAGKLLDDQSGTLKSGVPGIKRGGNNGSAYGKESRKPGTQMPGFGDSGGASRFFYCAKASKSERNKGLENMAFKKSIGHNRFDKCKTCGKYILQNQDRPSACQCENPVREDNEISGNHHPTVKPISLMRYLVRMITPKNGICLDPFSGSGTTGCALKVEGMNGVLIDKEKEYCEISRARIKACKPETEEKHVPDNKVDSETENKEEGKNKEQLSLF